MKMERLGRHKLRDNGGNLIGKNVLLDILRAFYYLNQINDSIGLSLRFEMTSRHHIIHAADTAACIPRLEPSSRSEARDLSKTLNIYVPFGTWPLWGPNVGKEKCSPNDLRVSRRAGLRGTPFFYQHFTPIGVKKNAFNQVKKIISSIFSLFISLAILTSCQPDLKEKKETTQEITDREEAREDSLELVAAYQRQSEIKNQVPVTLETDAVAAEASFDAADDPAVWVNAGNPEQSVIIGSNKKGGIYLYNLDGKTIAYFPVGNINNVDVLYGFDLGGEKVDLVGGSNRSDQSIDLFAITDNGTKLEDITNDPMQVDSTEIDDVYGFCFYQNPKEQKSYVFINGKNGRVQQFVLQATKSVKIAVEKVRDIQFDSQVEGMVADNLHGWLYVGEEDRGVWKLGADPDYAGEKILLNMSTEDNANISFDIEGLTLYEEGSEGYLIASSQGNFSYAVFDRNNDNTYITSFTVGDANQVDGVEETDGIEAISTPLGDRFPKGIFVAQDGFNYDGDTLVAQNFKIVDWREIVIKEN